MEIIKVNLGERSYDIQIGKGILKETDFRKFGAGKYAIITDSNVKRVYGGDLQKMLLNQGLEAELFAFPAGENSKNWEMAGKIGQELAKREFDKDSVIIALGGGVVGDLAGFVASFYKRGVNFIQIPTTLIGQVDSSIGGKTGVDIPEGKNLFGTFWQPKAVLIDTDFLKNLPEEEIKNGLAEVIKHGVIQDAELFKYLEENYSKRPEGFYLKIIKKSVEIQAKIVAKDEKEKELRKILNYGHTIGHAIESAEQYQIPHGRAVGLGMVYEGKIANKMGLLSEEDLKRQNQLIKAVGLPVEYKGDIKSLIEIMKKDKKAKSGEIYFILPTRIGRVKQENGRVSFSVDVSIIEECLTQ